MVFAPRFLPPKKPNSALRKVARVRWHWVITFLSEATTSRSTPLFWFVAAVSVTFHQLFVARLFAVAFDCAAVQNAISGPFRYGTKRAK